MSEPKKDEVWGLPGQPWDWRRVWMVSSGQIRYQEFGDDFWPWIPLEEWVKWVRDTGAVCITASIQK